MIQNYALIHTVVTRLCTQNQRSRRQNSKNTHKGLKIKSQDVFVFTITDAVLASTGVIVCLRCVYLISPTDNPAMRQRHNTSMGGVSVFADDEAIEQLLHRNCRLLVEQSLKSVTTVTKIK